MVLALIILLSIGGVFLFHYLLALVTGYNSLKKLYQSITDEFMALYIASMSLMMACVFFITLCAINNTSYHYSYY